MTNQTSRRAQPATREDATRRHAEASITSATKKKAGGHDAAAGVDESKHSGKGRDDDTIAAAVSRESSDQDRHSQATREKSTRARAVNESSDVHGTTINDVK